MLGGGGVLSALRADMLEKVRRAKGERRCCVRAARRRDMMGVWARNVVVVVGVCIGDCGGLWSAVGDLDWDVGKRK